MLGMCRICGKRNACEKSLNLFETKNRKLLRHIQMVSGLLLRNSPDVPVSICVCCQAELRRAMSFRRLCKKTQKKWQTQMSANGKSFISELESPTPTPSSPDDRAVVSTCKERESDGEPQHNTIEILLKESPLNNNLERTGLIEEYDHLDLNYILKPTIDIDTDDSDNLEGNATEKHESVESLQYSADGCKKLLKLNQELMIYICELCGAHINNKVSFERHIRKHTGERPFACEDCSSRFLSAAELRAHGLKHTGERPFPCRYCERRYVSYTGRLKHERMHINDRPFVCAQCGKAFTDAYVLKNHMLVHSGERSFRCDACQRTFQRKTHLQTHYRSNTHKQNIGSHQDQQSKIHSKIK